MANEPDLLELLSSAEELLDAVRRAPFPFDTPGRAASVALRDDVAGQLSNYVIPRLNSPDAPLLVVVGGSTGTGKSTLVNSLVGHHVSPSGVIRPTTRTPVLVHHPDDAAYFTGERVLPDIARTDGVDHYALRVESSGTVPQGVAILDAPDIDSVDEGNRALADQLLGAADLWLFVMSAARYADQVPWDHLRDAADRDAQVAVVLDRAPRDDVDTVRRHLARMMTARGLSESPLFTVFEGAVDERGVLPFEEIGQIVIWLQDTAQDQQGRLDVVVTTLHGALRHDVFRARDVADALDEQIQTVRGLRGQAEEAFETAAEYVLNQVGSPGLDLEATTVAGAHRGVQGAVDAWTTSAAGRAVLDDLPDTGPALRAFTQQAAQLAPGDSLRGQVLTMFGELAGTVTGVLPNPDEIARAKSALQKAANRADAIRLAIDLPDVLAVSTPPPPPDPAVAPETDGTDETADGGATGDTGDEPSGDPAPDADPVGGPTADDPPHADHDENSEDTAV